MKKYLVVLIALLFATGAFAQEAKKAADFKYSLSGTAFGVTGAQDDLQYDYTHIRVRPYLEVGNENVKGVVCFEIDQDYGKVDTDTGADKGTDNKVVEVKWAYLQVKDMLIQNLTFTMGLAPYYFPMVVDNDFAVTQAAYDFGMGKAIFSYIKLVEENYVENTDADVEQNQDTQAYAVYIPIKAGAIGINPSFVYLTSGKEASLDVDIDGDGTTDAALKNAKLYNAALNITADLGAANVELTGAYLAGKVDLVSTDAEVDVKAYALDAIVTIKPAEGISLALFATYTSGQDDSGDITMYDAAMEAYMGAPDGRLFLLEAGGVAGNGGYQPFDYTDKVYGLMDFGAKIEATFGKASVLAQYGYASVADDTFSGDSFIGHEIDLRAAYEVAPATQLFAEFGYIVAGDVVDDNAYEFAYGLSAKI